MIRSWKEMIRHSPKYDFGSSCWHSLSLNSVPFKMNIKIMLFAETDFWIQSSKYMSYLTSKNSWKTQFLQHRIVSESWENREQPWTFVLVSCADFLATCRWKVFQNKLHYGVEIKNLGHQHSKFANRKTTIKIEINYWTSCDSGVPRWICICCITYKVL